MLEVGSWDVQSEWVMGFEGCQKHLMQQGMLYGLRERTAALRRWSEWRRRRRNMHRRDIRKAEGPGGVIRKKGRGKSLLREGERDEE